MESSGGFLIIKLELILNKKIFLYCRVSTGMQQTGLESQVRALREYCHRFNINNFIIFEDENQSGTKKSRPALDNMMKRVLSSFF